MVDYNNLQSYLSSGNNDPHSMRLNMENIQQQHLFSQKTLATCSASSNEGSRTDCFGRPAKQLKTDNSWSSGTTADQQQLSPNPSPRPSHSSASSSHILTFGSTSLVPKDEAVSQGYMHFVSLGTESTVYGEQKFAPTSVGNVQGTKRAYPTTRSPSSAQDHIMAERKRREKLSQRFVALSAIVPGLKKMDKASVLGDAIKYLKLLQERVKVLEEQTKKRTMESAVLVKRSQVSSEDDSSSCNKNSDGQLDHMLPEIEARVSDKDVLIRIHVEECKGFVHKIMSEIENLHLCIVNSSAVPFGTSNLDITIIAKMEDEFCITAKDLVRKLRAASMKFFKDA
ncbi:hypothetical protein CDL15_Pgr019068 [Punica granatum]|nr:hypothetical protein CDL15_Pgr019068 [Punica granatum]